MTTLSATARGFHLVTAIALLFVPTSSSADAPLPVEARQHRYACVCEMCNRRPLDVCRCKQSDSMRIQLGLILAKLGGDEAAVDAAMVEKYSGAVLSPIDDRVAPKEVPWLGPVAVGVLGLGIAWQIVRTTRRRRARRTVK